LSVPVQNLIQPDTIKCFYKSKLILQGFRVAYVVFDDNRGLQIALKLGKNMQPLILSTEESPISCGLQSNFQLV
jgi:hypothetical protein